MKVQAVTDVGRERSVNQDYVYYSLTETGSLPNLFLVADGMGGHKAGDMASRYTVETFVSLVQDSTLKDPVSIINNAVTQVNRRLLQKAAESENYEGMGTTLVAATVYDNILRVANVGDSRLYILGNEITQITRDHSLVEEMVSMGEINREQARNHEKKNIITRAIGGYDTVEAEMFSVDLKAALHPLCSAFRAMRHKSRWNRTPPPATPAASSSAPTVWPSPTITPLRTIFMPPPPWSPVTSMRSNGSSIMMSASTLQW